MVGRYLRAFVVALRMTVRGETLPSTPNSALRDWMAQGLIRLDEVEALAAQYHIDPAAVTLHIDRRDIRMSIILGTVRHHLAEEYPILLRSRSPQGITLLHANNLDDHYRVTRLEALPELANTPVQPAVAALAAHLEAVPREK